MTYRILDNSWREYNLDEVYNFSSGLSKSRKEFGFGNPFVTFKDVFYNYFLPKELLELVNTNEKEILRCSVKRGDVFLTRTSETSNELGKSSVALKDYPNATFNGFTKRLRPKIDNLILPEYVGYYFRSNKFRNQIDSMVTMTTRASLNNDIMARLKVIVPPLEEQKAIAKILSDLDEKIETNNKINKKLEEMAQAIFKRWFVDFEFPNEEGKPYKNSGGEMVESELGIIPKEWKILKLENLCDIGSSKRIFLKEYRQKGIPFYRSKEIIELSKGNSINTEIFIDSEKLNEIKNKYGIPRKNDILLTSVGTLGTVYLVQSNDEFYFKDGNLTWFKNFKNDTNKYIYSFLKSNLGRKAFDEITIGSTQKALTISALKQIKILVPNEGILQQYENLIMGLIEKKNYNVFENRNLEKIRDILLPKLMSGEIRVN